MKKTSMPFPEYRCNFQYNSGGEDLDPLLSAAEERELSEAIGRGDEVARSRMIRANLRLVVCIARDYVGRGLPLDDLVGEGNLGLIRAVQDYDPAVGCRFSTYACHWIKQSIRQALLVTTPTIRLPAHMVILLTKWGRARWRSDATSTASRPARRLPTNSASPQFRECWSRRP